MSSDGLSVSRQRQSQRSSESKGTKSSKASLGAKLSNYSRSVFSRNTQTQKDELDIQVGDHCETISPTTMRKDEDIGSEVITELPIGASLEITFIGVGRRIRVRHQVGSNPAMNGWISAKTSLNEPLVMKRRYDNEYGTDVFEVGGQHEVKTPILLRKEEVLDSDPVGELKPGTIVRILELGKLNQRRAKVSADSQEGWISTVTKDGELLIGKVGDGGTGSSFFSSATAKTKELLDASRVGDLTRVKKVAEGSGGMMSRFGGKTNLNASDIRGKTALIYSSAGGHVDIVEYLLSRNKEVDVNALDDTQKSALHHAAKRAHQGDVASTVQAEIVESLLKNGAYMEARDHNGCTALIFAVANGDKNVVKHLIEGQADVNVRDFEGCMALDYARRFEHTEVERLLVAAGATSNDDEDGGSSCSSVSYSDSDSFCGDGEAHPISEPEHSEGTASATASATAKKLHRPKGGTSSAVPAGSAAPGGIAAGTASSPSKAKTAGGKKKGSSKKKASGVGDSAQAGGEKKSKAAAKKKAGAKGKAKAAPGKGKKHIDAKKLLEVLDDGSDDQQTEVHVQEAAKEEEDDKTRLLRKLKVVTDTVTSPSELSAVISQAEAAGANDDELKEAQAKLEELKKKNGVREQLNEAILNKDVKALKAVLPEAEKAGAPKADLEKARKVLKVEEPRQSAREKMQGAYDAGDMKQLKSAIAEAKKAGVPAEEIKEYEDMLAGAENKEKAEKSLKEAIASRDIGALKLAIQMAKDGGLEQALIDEAEAIVKEEGPKTKAREEVEAALESNDVDMMKKALETAKAAKLDASEVKEIEDAIKRKADQEKFMKEVTAALKASETCDMKDVDSVRAAKEQLAAAIASAIESGVPEADLSSAEFRRKKLHNTIEDLKGSIRVFCRIRPMNKRERDLKDHEITKQVDPMTLAVGEKGEHTFQFDAVFTPGTQEEIFEDCKDLVQSAVDGYNVTLFAYGQTGAGKTFTMSGVPGMLGVSPRTITEIYKVIDQGKSRYNYTVMGSMLELYRQDLVDLLAKGNPNAEKQKLNVRVEKNGMVCVEHLTTEQCNSAKELEHLLDRGTKARTVAATAMNSESSRSHLVLMVQIISVNLETKNQLRGKILIVDLAGSERLKKSQTTADMQKESIEINKSLTALGDVIEALTKNQKVIPYRNHKLTQLMQDALGGTAKTLMFVNCSPASNNEDETLMSLKYAQRAKQIKNQAATKKS